MFVSQEFELSSWLPTPPPEFQQAIDDVRQSLHERLLDRGTGTTRPGAASAAGIAAFHEKNAGNTSSFRSYTQKS